MNVRYSLSIFFAMLVAVTFGFSSTIHAEDAASDAGKEYTKRKLNTVIIPSIQFSNAPLSHAIGYLKVTSDEVERPGGSVNMILVGKLNEEPEATLSLWANQLPLGKALDYVCMLTGHEYDIYLGAIRIRPAAIPRLPNPSSWVQGKARDRAIQIVLPSVQFHAATVAEAVEFVRISLNNAEDAPAGISNMLIIPGDGPSIPIELDAKDITAWEAILQIASKSGHHALADDHAIILLPCNRQLK
jgi:hypothetical protein